MDQSHSFNRSALLAIPTPPDERLSKQRIEALSHLREVREMFDALMSNGTILPSSSSDEFFAIDHDSSRMRFFFDNDDNIVITLEGAARGLGLQIPNITELCTPRKTEDEIADELREIFGIMDQSLEHAHLLSWTDLSDEGHFAELESCELGGIPGLPGLIAGTHKYAMAAMRRELPTTYNRIAHNLTDSGYNLWVPSISLYDGRDGVETHLEDGESSPTKLFAKPIHAARFALPLMLGITKFEEGFLRLSRIHKVKFCPDLTCDATDVELDRCYDILGEYDPSMPRTSIEARQLDVDLAMQFEAEDAEEDEDEDFDIILDVIDAAAASNGSSPHSVIESSLSALMAGASPSSFGSPKQLLGENAPPESIEELVERIGKFIDDTSASGLTSSDHFLSLDQDRRFGIYISLKMARKLTDILELANPSSDIMFSDIATGQDAAEALERSSVREYVGKISETILSGLDAFIFLSAYLEKKHLANAEPAGSA